MSTSETSAEPRLNIAALSDVGLSRSMNQDFAYAGPVPGAEDWILLAVADGLGGHARGEWASERTVELLVASLAGLLQDGDPTTAFEAAVATANTTVNQEAAAQGSPGAATTLVAVLCRGREAWWVNVGDSRLYLVAQGAVDQISDDHSWVNDQVRAGNLPPEALRNHPNKNVVTRTVGFESVVLPETGGPIELALGEALVLCSDGLHGPVEDHDIARVVSTLDPRSAADRLVEMANEAGGPDNITVVIGRLEEPNAAQIETVIPANVTAEVVAPATAATPPMDVAEVGAALVAAGPDRRILLAGAALGLFALAAVVALFISIT